MELAKFLQAKHVQLTMELTLDGPLNLMFQAQSDVVILYLETPLMVLLNTAPFQIVRLPKPNAPTKMEHAIFLQVRHVLLIMELTLDGPLKLTSQLQLDVITLFSETLLMVLLNYVPTQIV